MQLVIIDGRIRRVSRVIGQISKDSTQIEVISGFHTKRVIKRKHPGSGFRKDPSKVDNWVRQQPQMTVMTVDTNLIIEVENWPIESLSDISEPVKGCFVNILRDRVIGALNSEAASRYTRTPPSIRWETIELDAKAEGLPQLSQNDLDVLTKQAWEDTRPKSKRSKPTSNIVEIIEQAREAESEAEIKARAEREAAALRRAKKADQIAQLEAKRDQARQRGWPEETIINLERDDEKNDWGRTLNFMSRVNFNREKHAPDGWVPADLSVIKLDESGEAEIPHGFADLDESITKFNDEE